MLPWKQFQCWSDWRWPFLVLSRKTRRAHPLFLRLSLLQAETASESNVWESHGKRGGTNLWASHVAWTPRARYQTTLN